MKKSIFLSFILCLCLVACIPQQAMAQKQSRMEKLLRYLNDNDADKWRRTGKNWMTKQRRTMPKIYH